MSKKSFDPGLYRDAMRQLMPMGMICCFLFVLQAILLPMQEVIGITKPNKPALCGLIEVNPGSVAIFCVFLPLMTIFLFNFLTRRNASDFYHAIPQTRSCIYISFTAALLTFMLIMQISSTLLTMAIDSFFPAYYKLDISGILLQSLQLLAAEIFVLGAVLLAVSMTGNLMTNLVVSLLIIFGPRLLMLVIHDGVASTLNVCTDDTLSFFGNGWNVAADMIFNLMRETSDSLNNLRAGAYTALLGMIYMICGCLVFIRRPSEAAGQAAVGPKLQLTFRLIPAFLFSLIPTAMLFKNLTTDLQNLNARRLYQICVLYFISMLIYFFYELLSTRKFRNLPRALPGLAILVILNVLLIFSMYGVRSEILSFEPAAAQIDSVRFPADSVYVWNPNMQSSSNYPGYFSSRVADEEFEDPGLIQTVAECLAVTNACDRNPNEELQNKLLRKVAIRIGNKVYNRNIGLSDSDQQVIARYLKTSSKVREIYMNLPESDSDDFWISIDPYVGNCEFSQEMCEKIYEALKEDVADMGFDSWYMMQESGSGNYNTIATLYFSCNSNGKQTAAPINLGDKTPKAMQACVDTCFEQQKAARESAISVLDLIQAGLTEYPDLTSWSGYISMTSYELYGRGQSMTYEVDCKNILQLNALRDLLKSMEDQKIDVARGYTEVYIDLAIDHPADSSLADGEDLFENGRYCTNVSLLIPYVDSESCSAFSVSDIG